MAQRDSAASPVTLTPQIVIAGAPELIRVSAPGATSVDGEWLTRKVAFFRDRDQWVALAGVDVAAPISSSTLHITAHLNGTTADLTRTIEIHAAHYRTESLGVQPKFVEPSPEALKEIHEQSEVKAKVFASSAPEPLWHGDFHAPVSAAATDSFGVRRMFNGKLASIHKGADFRAHTGTPVHAGNSGVVVLARPLYYEGNCVIIDHGQRFFTIYMHLKQTDVHMGDTVQKGRRLGLSGATGRVTGPHMHLGVRWNGAYLDPVQLLAMTLPKTGAADKETNHPGSRSSVRRH